MERRIRCGIFGAVLLCAFLVLNAGCGNPEEALLEAVNSGKTRRVERLLKKGADIETKDRYGKTLLMIAADEGRVDVARILIENGADLNAKAEGGRTVLMYAVVPILTMVGKREDISTYSSYQIAELLLQAGAEVNARDEQGDSALTHVLVSICHNTDEEVYGLASLLIANGADVNIMDNEGCAPLNLGYGPLEKLLKDAGATVVGEDCAPMICT